MIKFNQGIDPSSLGGNEPHILADFVEILCVFSKDGEITFGDTAIEDHQDQFDDPVDEEDELEEPYDEVIEAIWGSTSELIENGFGGRRFDHAALKRLLIGRERLYGRYYPFEIDERGEVIVLKSQLRRQNILYLYLLYATHSTDFPDSKELEDDFELLTGFIVKRLLNDTAQIHHVGTAPNSPFISYTGNKAQKLSELAEKLGLAFIGAEDYSKHDVGDAGIDIVANHPELADSAGKFMVIFAQAGTTSIKTSVIAKQHDVDAEKLKNFFPGVMPVPILTSPMCFRKSSGKFLKEGEITISLIDRSRIVRILSKSLSRKKINILLSLKEVKNDLNALGHRACWRTL